MRTIDKIMKDMRALHREIAMHAERMDELEGHAHRAQVALTQGYTDANALDDREKALREELRNALQAEAKEGL